MARLRTPAVGLGAALVSAFALTGCGGSNHDASTATSSRLIHDGTLRATVTARDSLAVGRPLTVTFAITNVSKGPRSIQLGYPEDASFAIRSPDGETYDTGRPTGPQPNFGIASPVGLRPGQTVRRRRSLPVRWRGPLRVTPSVDGARLPALHIGVTTPGRAPTERAAIASVVAATTLLDHCRPHEAGLAVSGRIESPEHGVPPQSARCSITLRRHRGFVVAHVRVVVPQRRRWSAGSSFGHNSESIDWDLVVTRRGATSIDSISYFDSRGCASKGCRGKPVTAYAPGWLWTASGTKPGIGLPCGTGTAAHQVAGPMVVFVSACPRGWRATRLDAAPAP